MAVGFFPFERRHSVRGLPASVLCAWQHPYAPLATPLLHLDYAVESLRLLMQWAVTSGRTSLLEFPMLLAEGRSFQAFVDALRMENGLFLTIEQYTRALLVTDGQDGNAYLRKTISGPVLKEVRRQRRRLEEQGTLELRVLGDADDAASWLEAFLVLEASGWKARHGTATDCSDVWANYFRSIGLEAHSRRRLWMLGLFLHNRPIAMKCNFLCRDGAFALKIAYDEAYSKYSPGVLLELENIIVAHEKRGLRWLDSCAVPNHPMINRLWGERRTIQHLLMATPAVKSAMLLAAVASATAMKRALKMSMRFRRAA